MATLFITVESAGELCAREHTLGTCGAVAVEVRLDGRAGRLLAATSTRPSFPRPSWLPPRCPPSTLRGEVLEVLGVAPSAILSLVLVDRDPLQPPTASGEVFSFGRVELQLPPTAGEPVAPQVYRKCPLVASPGSQGYLTFSISRRAPPAQYQAGVGAGAEPEIVARQEVGSQAELCGVLGVACGPSTAGRVAYEMSIGACVFRTWTYEGDAPTGPQWLHLCERDVPLRVHATSQLAGSGEAAAASGEMQLGEICARGGDAAQRRGPAALALAWRSAGLQGDGDAAPRQGGAPRMHFRFFHADFLRPGACGIPVFRFTLVMASRSCPLPLSICVPAAVFGPQRDNADADEEFAFDFVQLGVAVEICLPEPFRLVGHSLWRVVALDADGVAQSGGDPAQECVVDVLALQLRQGGERVISGTLGSHTLVLRASLLVLDPQVPRALSGGSSEVEATSLSDRWPPPLALLRPRGGGEMVGLLVHALAVHSAAVTRCVLFGGVGGCGAVVVSLPLALNRGRTFVAIEASCGAGAAILWALLPDHGVSASTPVVFGDGVQQLQWTFPSPGGDVHAGALVTAVRWPAVASGVSVLPLQLEVGTIPDATIVSLAPVTCSLSDRPGNTFTWEGGGAAPESTLLSLSLFDEGLGSLEIRCGAEQLAVSIFLLDVLELQVPDRSAVWFPILYGEAPRPGTNVARPRRALLRTKFLYLPMRLHWQVERVGQPLPASEFHGSGVSGLLLLQGVSLLAAPGAEAHCKHCSAAGADAPWEPGPDVSMISTGDQHPGIRRRGHAVGSARARRLCGAVACWNPLDKRARLVDLVPYIVATPFVVVSPRAADFRHAASELHLQLELKLTCTACGQVATLTATPQVPLLASALPPWQSFTVDLDVFGAGWRGTSALGPRRGGVACARLFACTSRFMREPEGLLSLSLRALQDGGPGVPELLRQETAASKVQVHPAYFRAGMGGEAAFDVAVAVRLGIDGGASVLIDGTRGVSEQLYVETSARHLERSVTLEVQERSGARRLLTSVSVPILGALGDGRSPVVFPLIMRRGIRLALVAEYEAHVACRGGFVGAADADASEGACSPRVPKALPAEDVRGRLVNEIGQLQRRVASPEFLVPSRARSTSPGTSPRRSADGAAGGGRSARGARAAPARPSSASVAPARAARTPRRASSGGERRFAGVGGRSHAFLERGDHLWLAPRGPKAAIASNRFWSQEMERRRPSSQPRAAGSGGVGTGGGAAGAGAVGAIGGVGAAGTVPGHSGAGRDNTSGVKDEALRHQRELMDKEKADVHKLREQLKPARAGAQRAERRLAHARLHLRVAEQELHRGGIARADAVAARSPKPASLPYPGGAVGAWRGGGNDGEGEAGDGVVDCARPGAPQFCTKCQAVPLHLAALRFCEGCLPGVKLDVCNWQASVGHLLLQRASLRGELEVAETETRRLLAEHTALGEQVAAAEDGEAFEGNQASLRPLVQLRALLLGAAGREASERALLALLAEGGADAEERLARAEVALLCAAAQSAEIAEALRCADQEFGEL